MRFFTRESKTPGGEGAKRPKAKEQDPASVQLNADAERKDTAVNELDGNLKKIEAAAKKAGVDIGPERAELEELKKQYVAVSNNGREALAAANTDGQDAGIEIIDLSEERRKRQDQPDATAKTQGNGDTRTTQADELKRAEAEKRAFEERQRQIDTLAKRLHEIWQAKRAVGANGKHEQYIMRSIEGVVTTKRIDVANTPYESLPRDIQKHIRDFSEVMYTAVQNVGPENIIKLYDSSDGSRAEREMKRISNDVFKQYQKFIDQQKTAGKLSKHFLGQFYLLPQTPGKLGTSEHVLIPSTLLPSFVTEAAVQQITEKKKRVSKDVPATSAKTAVRVVEKSEVAADMDIAAG